MDTTHNNKSDQQSTREKDRPLFTPDTIPSPAISALPDGSIDFINQRWLEYLGLTLEDVRGWGWTVAIHPEDVERFMTEWRAAIQAGESIEKVARFRRSDGEYHRFLLRIDPLRDEQGRIIRWHGTRVDIEDRKQAEEKFKALIESAPDAMVIINEEGKILIVNSQTEKLFGYGREELYGQTVEMLIPDRFRGRHLGHRTDYIGKPKTRAMGAGLELYGLRKDGSEFPIDLSLSPLNTEEGVMVTAAIRDITERKRAESRLNTQYAITRILSESASIDEAAPRIVQSICECLDWKVGEIWRVDGETKLSTFVQAWHLPSGDFAEFTSASLLFTFPPGVGLPGRVCESRKPLWIRNLAEDSNFLRVSLATMAGLHCGFGFPILLGEETLGAMVFFSCEVREPDHDMLQMMANIGSQIGQFIERKRAEEELRRSEFYLSEGQRLGHMGTWAFDPSGFFNHWSRELFQIFGLDPAKGAPTLEEYLGLVHPQDHEFVARTIKGMLVEGLGCDFTKRIVRPDDELRYIRCVGVPVVNDGVLKYFIGTALDVTEHEYLTQKLRQNEREFRQIVEAIPEHIVVLTPDGSALYANKTVLEYTGLTLEEVQAGDFRERAFHPEDVKRLREERQQSLSRGVPFELEQRALGKDGRYRWFLIRYNPVRDERGHVVRWYATGTDIDDRKQSEERTRNENIALREEVDKASMFEEIVGASPAVQAVLTRVAKVAPTDSTVLITGETGTGKELIARAIHKRSPRSARAFVSVNCAAVPLSLIASELFGHEKGAFTGALQRRLGRFELAEGGTIFLDEIGELPAETQIALLRVLQEHEFERVGGNQAIRANVRVIAATNRDLKVAIDAGDFRSDLFYRLNVFPIEMPPLRERKEDISMLVEYFIDRYASKAGKKIRGVSKKTLDLFQSYPWPGNVRELQNVIERSVIVCETERFSVDEGWLAWESRQTQLANQPLAEKLLNQEKEMIEAALAESRGRVSGPSGAAAKLGIPASTLESKIRSLKINKHRFKPA